VTDKLPIVTGRTVLRRLAPTDPADFQHYRHDEDVGQYQDWLPQMEADAVNFLNKSAVVEFFQPGKWFQIGIAKGATGYVKRLHQFGILRQ
jgi:hypothetical protein